MNIDLLPPQNAPSNWNPLPWLRQAGEDVNDRIDLIMLIKQCPMSEEFINEHILPAIERKQTNRDVYRWISDQDLMTGALFYQNVSDEFWAKHHHKIHTASIYSFFHSDMYYGDHDGAPNLKPTRMIPMYVFEKYSDLIKEYYGEDAFKSFVSRTELGLFS
jgi:hypothetical protein